MNHHPDKAAQVEARVDAAKAFAGGDAGDVGRTQ